MERKKQTRFEYFKVVSYKNEVKRTHFGPGTYGGAIEFIIHDNSNVKHMHLEMVYMKPRDALKEKKKVDALLEAFKKVDDEDVENNIQVEQTPKVP
jgi:hypothetical protein